MLMNSHFLIAKSLLNNIDNNKLFFINEKHFIYGNLKPDAVPQYVFKKHYLNESFDTIAQKINYLCSLTIDSLSRYFSVSKFSQELGVICHFLCDFFCVPHSERWEFKINYLCSLTIDSLSRYFSVSKFSQELGVICHFLCDFFCVPHSERWEFKHSMKKHMSYEKELSIVAKNSNLSIYKGDIITNNFFKDFFDILYTEYKSKLDYENDLFFSSYACNSVINYILDNILKNTVSSNIILKFT